MLEENKEKLKNMSNLCLDIELNGSSLEGLKSSSYDKYYLELMKKASAFLSKNQMLDEKELHEILTLQDKISTQIEFDDFLPNKEEACNNFKKVAKKEFYRILKDEKKNSSKISRWFKRKFLNNTLKVNSSNIEEKALEEFFDSFQSRKLEEMIKQKLSQFNEFIISGGSNNFSSDELHAMRYQVKKVASPSGEFFQLTIINTGEGIDNHPKFQNGKMFIKEYKLNTLEDLQRVISGFHKVFIAEIALSLVDKGIISSSPKNEFYLNFKSKLDSKASELSKINMIYTIASSYEVPLTEEEMANSNLLTYNGQMAGSCVARSLNVLTRLELGNSRFEKILRLRIKMESIIDSDKSLINDVLSNALTAHEKFQVCRSMQQAISHVVINSGFLDRKNDAILIQEIEDLKKISKKYQDVAASLSMVEVENLEKNITCSANNEIPENKLTLDKSKPEDVLSQIERFKDNPTNYQDFESILLSIINNNSFPQRTKKILFADFVKSVDTTKIIESFKKEFEQNSDMPLVSLKSIIDSLFLSKKSLNLFSMDDEQHIDSKLVYASEKIIELQNELAFIQKSKMLASIGPIVENLGYSFKRDFKLCSKIMNETLNPLLKKINDELLNKSGLHPLTGIVEKNTLANPENHDYIKVQKLVSESIIKGFQAAEHVIRLEKNISKSLKAETAIIFDKLAKFDTPTLLYFVQEMHSIFSRTKFIEENGNEDLNHKGTINSERMSDSNVVGYINECLKKNDEAMERVNKIDKEIKSKAEATELTHEIRKSEELVLEVFLLIMVSLEKNSILNILKNKQLLAKAICGKHLSNTTDELCEFNSLDKSANYATNEEYFDKNAFSLADNKNGIVGQFFTGRLELESFYSQKTTYVIDSELNIQKNEAYLINKMYSFSESPSTFTDLPRKSFLADMLLRSCEISALNFANILTSPENNKLDFADFSIIIPALYVKNNQESQSLIDYLASDSNGLIINNIINQINLNQHKYNYTSLILIIDTFQRIASHQIKIGKKVDGNIIDFLKKQNIDKDKDSYHSLLAIKNMLLLSDKYPTFDDACKISEITARYVLDDDKNNIFRNEIINLINLKSSLTLDDAVKNLSEQGFVKADEQLGLKYGICVFERNGIKYNFSLNDYSLIPVSSIGYTKDDILSPSNAHVAKLLQNNNISINGCELFTTKNSQSDLSHIININCGDKKVSITSSFMEGKNKGLVCKLNHIKLDSRDYNFFDVSIIGNPVDTELALMLKKLYPSYTVICSANRVIFMDSNFNSVFEIENGVVIQAERAISPILNINNDNKYGYLFQRVDSTTIKLKINNEIKYYLPMYNLEFTLEGDKLTTVIDGLKYEVHNMQEQLCSTITLKSLVNNATRLLIPNTPIEKLNEDLGFDEYLTHYKNSPSKSKYQGVENKYYSFSVVPNEPLNSLDAITLVKHNLIQGNHKLAAEMLMKFERLHTGYYSPMIITQINDILKNFGKKILDQKLRRMTIFSIFARLSLHQIKIDLSGGDQLVADLEKSNDLFISSYVRSTKEANAILKDYLLVRQNSNVNKNIDLSEEEVKFVYDLFRKDKLVRFKNKELINQSRILPVNKLEKISIPEISLSWDFQKEPIQKSLNRDESDDFIKAESVRIKNEILLQEQYLSEVDRFKLKLVSSLENFDIDSFKHKIFLYQLRSQTKSKLESLLSHCYNLQKIEPIKTLVETNKLPTFNLDILIKCFVQNDLNIIQKYLGVTQEVAGSILESYRQIIIAKIYNSRIDNVSKLLKANDNSFEYKASLAKAINDISSCYDMNDTNNKHLLLMESILNIRLTPKQVSIIREIGLNSNVGQSSISQMVMGGGKTSVVLPLIAYNNATADKLSLIIVPETQLTTNQVDLSNSYNKSFSSAINTLRFDKNRELDISYIESIYALINNSKALRQPLLVSKETIQSLELSLIHIISNQRDGDLSQVYKDILNELKSSNAIIDEVDTILDINHEFNFSYGGLSSIPTFTVNDTLYIYKKINFQKHYKDKKTLNENIEFLKEEISNWDVWKENNISHNTVLQFLNNSKEAFKEINGLKIDKNLKDRLGALRAQLNEVIPRSTSFENNLNYGLPKNSKVKPFVAVPYKFNNVPEENSVFTSEYETLDLTIQTILLLEKSSHDYNILKKEFMSFVMSDYYNRALKDKLEIEKDLYEIFGLTFIELSRKVKDVGIENIEEINTEALKFGAVKYVVANTIKTSNGKIISNPINFVKQLGKVDGVSGTLTNASSFENSLNVPNESMVVDGITAELINRKRCNVTQLKNDKINKSNLQSFLGEHLAGDVRAIIDIGALFEGLSNEMLAKKIGEFVKNANRKEIKHILFYKNNNLCAYSITDGNLIDLESTNVEYINKTLESLPEDRITFYDQSHCIGSDIKQSEHALAIATIGKGTTLKDLLQGTMRMRGFPNNQKISYLTSNETKLPKYDSMGLIKFCHENEIMKVQGMNLSSAVKSFRAVVRNLLLDYLKSSSNAVGRQILRDPTLGKYFFKFKNPSFNFSEDKKFSSEEAFEILLQECLNDINYFAKFVDENNNLDEKLVDSSKRELQKIKNLSIKNCPKEFYCGVFADGQLNFDKNYIDPNNKSNCHALDVAQEISFESQSEMQVNINQKFQTNQSADGQKLIKVSPDLSFSKVCGKGVFLEQLLNKSLSTPGMTVKSSKAFVADANAESNNLESLVIHRPDSQLVMINNKVNNDISYILMPSKDLQALIEEQNQLQDSNYDIYCTDSKFNIFYKITEAGMKLLSQKPMVPKYVQHEVKLLMHDFASLLEQDRVELNNINKKDLCNFVTKAIAVNQFIDSNIRNNSRRVVESLCDKTYAKQKMLFNVIDELKSSDSTPKNNPEIELFSSNHMR